MSPDHVRPANEIERPPFMVTLGLMPPYMAEDIEKAYLARVKDIRPDLGGDPKPFYEVQNAYMQAKEYVKFRGDRRGWIAKRMEEYLAVQDTIEGIKQFGAQVETTALDWLQKSFGDFAELTESILSICLNDSATGKSSLNTSSVTATNCWSFAGSTSLAARLRMLRYVSSAYFAACRT